MKAPQEYTDNMAKFWSEWLKKKDTQDNVSTLHKGLPVHGYKEQSEANVKLVNQAKVAEEHTLRMLDALTQHPDYDKRWLNVARTHIEQGFMAMNRAIFKPSRLTLPGDLTPDAD